MFMIGDVNPDMQKLVQVTKECMEIGIAAAQPWKQLGDVGAAIQEHAEKNGYLPVAREYGVLCAVEVYNLAFCISVFLLLLLPDN